MYCTNCANQLPDHAKFCTACGAKTALQLRAEGSPAAPPPQNPPVAAPTAPPAMPYAPPQQNPPVAAPAAPPATPYAPQQQNPPVAAPTAPPAMPYAPPQQNPPVATPTAPPAMPYAPPPVAAPAEFAQPPAVPHTSPGNQGAFAPPKSPKSGKALPVLAALALMAAAVTGGWRFGLLDALPFLSSGGQQDIPAWVAVADATPATAPVFAKADANGEAQGGAAAPEREDPQPEGDSRENALRTEEEANMEEQEGETAGDVRYTEEEMYDLMERGLLTEEQQKNFEMELARRAEMEAAGLEGRSGNVQSWGGVSITVLASSAMEGNDYSYAAGNVLDNDPGTAWIEDTNGNGIGEWIMVMTTNTTPAWLSHLAVQNGYQKSKQTYTENARVKDIVIDFSDGLQMEYTLQDITGWQEIPLPPDLETSYFKITILTVYPGSLYEFTGISGIECW